MREMPPRGVAPRPGFRPCQRAFAPADLLLAPMKTLIQAILSSAVLTLAQTALATEYHVATNGNDSNPGTGASPFRTIQHAASLAQPGDVVTVHAGVYRERVNPPRGGTAELARIVYQAAAGEKVEIKGSEPATGWVKVQDDVWKLTLPNSFFGKFNPYKDLIHGDWFNPKGREHHTGAVYLNGEWLTEAAKLDEVLNPAAPPAWLKDSPASNPLLWFAQVDGQQTLIWAQFRGVNPNEQLVEINVRQTVFYPDQPGRDYITVRGFTMSQAATPWAPPTAEQIGLIGTHWSKRWIIENNVIHHSICCGISLGKHGDEFDNTSADTAEGYVKTIERAHAFVIPWTRDHVGHHLVRNNTVSHCEQAGIVGSLGPIFSTITGNVIHDIHVRRLFSGAEMAGIKLHGAIDTEISHNHIYRTTRGLWLDWMAQGTHVTRNLFHDNRSEDLFVEVNHGPFLVDNNLFLSPVTLLDMSEGGAYAHNLVTGKIISRPELKRETPIHTAHKTKIAGLVNIKGGDNRFYNNLFIGNGTPDGTKVDEKSSQRAGFGLWVYDSREFPMQTGGNVFLNGARAYGKEADALAAPETVPAPRLVEKAGSWVLEFTLPPVVEQAKTRLVTTELLGKTRIPNLAYEDVDGARLKLITDYAGKPRNPDRPWVGPFENPGSGPLTLTVW